MASTVLLMRQLKAICTIRYLEKRRNLSVTFCEYFSHFIILLLLMLGFVLSAVVPFPDSNYAQLTVELPPSIDAINTINQILQGPLIVPTLNTYLLANDVLSQISIGDSTVSALLTETSVGQQFGNLWIKGRVHLAPTGPYTESFLSYLNRTTPSLNISEVMVHASESQGIDYILSHLEERALALIVLRQITPSKVNYVIRVNYTTLPNTNRVVNRFTLGLDPTYQSYFLSGFLSLQSAVDRWVFEYIDDIGGRAVDDIVTCSGTRRGVNNFTQYNFSDFILGSNGTFSTVVGGSIQPNNVVFVPQPVYAYDQNPFYAAVGFLLGLSMTMATMYPLSRLTKGIVEEKETRMREVMKVMGLHSSVHQLSWVITGITVFLWIAVTTAWVANSTFLPASDFSLLLIFFVLFCASLISLAFLLSTFFSNSKLAAIVAPVALFCLLLPRFVFFTTNSNEQFTPKVYASLLSPVAFAFGADFIAVAEGGGTGVQYSNIDDGQFSFRVVLQMMAVDSILYMVLGWYLDLVMPQEFGTPLSPLFIVDPEYWFGYSFKQLWAMIAHNVSAAEVATLSREHRAREQARMEIPPELLEENVEVQDEGRAISNSSAASWVKKVELLSPLERANVRVTVRGLVKAYPNGKLALRGLSLAMCENQITCLLGHNGAGKSTFCSVLTGLFLPTAGSCSIYGNDLSNDLAAIRQITGLCPQQNVIFPGLTVQEHLVFFASIKGFYGQRLEQAVRSIIQEVGLTEKQHVASGSLSGGMKRKLCLAMALVGDPKFVLLDEPTSGMDPYSRRSTWDILKKCKQGKVIVLTTHFMDEADILGDRIMIMAHGRLQCSGSSLFLKNNYGVGYILTVLRRARVALTETEKVGEDDDGERVPSVAATGTHVDPVACFRSLTEGITRLIPDVAIDSAVMGEIVYRLPISSTPKFAELFAYLTSAASSLGVGSYGLSITTLEQVFIKLAKAQQLLQDEVQESEDEDIHNDVGSYVRFFISKAVKSAHMGASVVYEIVSTGAHDDGSAESLSGGSQSPAHLTVAASTVVGTVTNGQSGEICEPAPAGAVEDVGVGVAMVALGCETLQPVLAESLQSETSRAGAEKVFGSVSSPQDGIDIGMDTDRNTSSAPDSEWQVICDQLTLMSIQLVELFRKRLIVALRDFKGIFFQIFFPCLQILAVLAILTVEINPAGHTLKLRASTFHPNPYDAEVVDNTKTPTGSGSDANDVAIHYLEEKFTGDRTKTCGAYKVIDGYCPDPGSPDARPFMSSHAVSDRYLQQEKTDEPLILSPTPAPIQQNYSDNTFRMGTYVFDDTLPVNLTVDWGFVKDILLNNSTNSSGTTSALLDLFGLPSSGVIGGFSIPIKNTGSLSTNSLFGNLLGGFAGQLIATDAVSSGINSLNISFTTIFNSTNAVVTFVLFGVEFTATVPQVFENVTYIVLDAVNSTIVNITNTLNTAVNGQLADAEITVNVGSALVDWQAREVVLFNVAVTVVPGKNSSLVPFTVDVPGNVTLTAANIAGLLPDGKVEYNLQLGGIGATIIHNSTSPHGGAIFQGELLQGMFEQCSPARQQGDMLSSSPTPVYLVKNHPLPITSQQSLEIKVVLALFASLFILVPLCYIPASFVTFVVRERAVKSKHLQLVSSVSPFLYWIATYLWDMLLYSILALFILLILYAYGGGSDSVFLSNGESSLAMFLLLISYGASVIPLSYLYSFAFDNHSTAQISIMMINFLTGFVCVLAYFIMVNIPSTQQDAKVAVVFFRAFPPYNIGEGLINLSSQYFFNNLLGQQVGYLAWEVTGRNIVYMGVETVGYLTVVLLSESNWCRKIVNELNRQRVLHVVWCTDILRGALVSLGPTSSMGLVLSRMLGIDSRNSVATGNQKPLDVDVADEQARVSHLSPDDAVLIISQLTKSYTSSLLYGGQIKRAVRGLSLACPKNERFGLLGINGAGKTSLTQVLTGDTVMTSGDVHIGGLALSDPRTREVIGYCPQTDPLLDLMTGRETLWFFGRIRGAKSIHAAARAAGISTTVVVDDPSITDEPDGGTGDGQSYTAVKTNVQPRRRNRTPEELLSLWIDALIIEIGLKNYADKPCGTYSGGNKRKLSLAIALIGNPKLLLLDEPSSGMDALARRKMWDVIQRVSVGRTVILTTHSMDECEALCSRVGIMVGGQLQCLGSCQHLKHRFGDGYQVEIRCVVGRRGGGIDSDSEGVALTSSNADQVWNEWVQLVPSSILEEKYDYYMRIRTAGEVALAPVFALLQRLKDANMVQDFNLSQATLEQIFIGFAKDQEEEPQQSPQLQQQQQQQQAPSVRPQLIHPAAAVDDHLVVST